MKPKKKQNINVIPTDKKILKSQEKLEAALIETKENIKEGKFVKETVEKHIKRITRG